MELIYGLWESLRTGRVSRCRNVSTMTARVSPAQEHADVDELFGRFGFFLLHSASFY